MYMRLLCQKLCKFVINDNMSHYNVAVKSVLKLPLVISEQTNYKFFK